jgi:coproporphyrinogen III oxidase-like Fe-S oxidoreductase
MDKIRETMESKGVTLEALQAELSNMSETEGTAARVASIVGGGTPTRLEAQRIAAFLAVEPTELWNDFASFKNHFGI